MTRTIIVGDVHGCSAELSELLSKLALASDDALLFVGDLVNRGPDSHGVLDIARRHRARVTLGNHEQRLLAARRSRADSGTEPRPGSSLHRLLQELSEEDWQLIETMPLKIDLPEHDLRIVHAGVLPGVPFEELDPTLVTHLRSIDRDGTPSDRWGPPWAAHYVGPPHVVFGHNARELPQLHRDATGIDTGCVYGGALTAMVLGAGDRPPPPEHRPDVLVSVKARQAYADYGRALSSN